MGGFTNMNLSEYLSSSERRKLLDKLQQKYVRYYKGVVLDIGGRDLGKFKKPKKKVEKWIFADIEAKHKPDVILDVANMHPIKTESVDVVTAIELFEHVKEVRKGLNECNRVLKKDGVLILSAPFLYRIHSDPHDYQRYTKEKWEYELKNTGFKIIKLEIMGKFFTQIVDMNKIFIRNWWIPLRILGYFFFPLLDLIVKLDKFADGELAKFHGGYFIIAKKINSGRK